MNVCCNAIGTPLNVQMHSRTDHAIVHPPRRRAGHWQGFCTCLGEAGASVAVADINLQAAQSVEKELRDKGVRSIAVGTDVTAACECKR